MSIENAWKTRASLCCWCDAVDCTIMTTKRPTTTTLHVMCVFNVYTLTATRNRVHFHLKIFFGFSSFSPLSCTSLWSNLQASHFITMHVSRACCCSCKHRGTICCTKKKSLFPSCAINKSLHITMCSLSNIIESFYSAICNFSMNSNCYLWRHCCTTAILSTFCELSTSIRHQHSAHLQLEWEVKKNNEWNSGRHNFQFIQNQSILWFVISFHSL